MRKLAVLTFVSTVFGLCSCNHPAGTQREPDEYVGCSTDENWVTFDDQEPSAVVSDPQSPKLVSPTATTFTVAQKPVFTWQRTATEIGAPLGDVEHPGLNPDLGNPNCNDCCPGWNKGELATFHEPPLSGNVYDLQLSVDGAAVSHRALTTLQEWTPPDGVWASWAGHRVALKMWRMSLLQNAAKEGPFIAMTPYQFQVTN